MHNTVKVVKILISIILLTMIFVTILFSQNKQEIVLKIDDMPLKGVNHFYNAEEMKERMNFFGAIDEYKKTFVKGEICGKEDEAQYNIGLCYCNMFDYDKADSVFKSLLIKYPDNEKLNVYTQYCLSIIDCKKGEFVTAAKRIESALNENCIFNDIKFRTIATYKLGVIYSLYLKNYEKAYDTFKKIREVNPEYTDDYLEDLMKECEFKMNKKGE